MSSCSRTFSLVERRLVLGDQTSWHEHHIDHGLCLWLLDSAQFVLNWLQSDF